MPSKTARCKVHPHHWLLTIDGNGHPTDGTTDPITDLCNLSELVSVGTSVTIRDFLVNAANP